MESDQERKEPLDGGIRVLEITARQDPDPRMRQYACFLIGTLGGPAAAQILIDALRDPEKPVRAQAARALGSAGGESLPILIPLLSDQDWKVRYRVCEAIGLINSNQSFGPLVGALADERDHVRYMAAKGLGQLGDKAATASIARLLSDENLFVRKAAASALGCIGGNTAYTCLNLALTREQSDIVIKSIKEALKEIEERRN